MRRFVAFIAVIFTFASIMGATVAHAHRYVSTPIVVLNHVDADNQAIPVIVDIQRGEIDLGAGIMLPCGSHPAIEVSVVTLPVGPRAALPQPVQMPVSTDWPAHLGLRPPISA